MDQEAFVKVVVKNVQEAAATSTLRSIVDPPGRRLSPDEIQMAHWYKGLGVDDKANLEVAIRKAVETAVFGFLCLLDGVRSVGDGKLGKFHLSYLVDGEEHQISPGEEDLHDIYSAISSSG